MNIKILPSIQTFSYILHAQCMHSGNITNDTIEQPTNRLSPVSVMPVLDESQLQLFLDSYQLVSFVPLKHTNETARTQHHKCLGGWVVKEQFYS